MRETDLGWVFSGIGSQSALGVRWDEMRDRVLELNCKHSISGWLERGSDRGFNDENLLSICLPKLIFQSQGLTAFLRP